MRLTALLPCLLVFTLGCGDDTDTSSPDPDPVDTCDACVDEDGDGWTVDDGDCDDTDISVHPGLPELCNGLDDNCNGDIDEGLADADGDRVCDALDSEDCDGIDNDGDGLVDEDFADEDGDGLADCVDSEDCDGIDNDGDGTIDEGYDADGDGYTQCGVDGEDIDCDDAVADVNPGEMEDDADEIDNDCDGLIDEGRWEPGDLMITEIMTNPAAVADPAGEWFEVVNVSGSARILNGLTLSDRSGEAHMVAADAPIVLAAGVYFVFGADARADANGGVNVDYAYDDLVLGNGSDSLVLSIIDGDSVVEIDAVEWDAGVTFPDTSGASMSLEPGSPDHADGASWCSAPVAWAPLSDLGSPGQANPLCHTIDHDGDLVTVEAGDCDDSDPTIYAGAPEIDPLVDNDCDGDVEQAPVAVPALGSGSSGVTCGVVYLDGSASTDEAGDDLTFSWELVSVPAGSALDSSHIVDADAELAEFHPDIAGAYTVSLTVFDEGGASSAVQEVLVNIAARPFNTVPVADAGGNQTGSDTTECFAVGSSGYYECDPCDVQAFLLDGTGSFDGDGDELTYRWTLTTGSAMLDDPTSPTPTLTLSGSTPTSATPATETVFVNLQVTDCLGEADSDLMAVHFACEPDF